MPRCACYSGLIYVINRFGQDNIQVIDPGNHFATVKQFSTGNGSNPQDIAFLSATKAYVARYGSSDLLDREPEHRRQARQHLAGRVRRLGRPAGDGASGDRRPVAVRGLPAAHQLRRLQSRAWWW